ncbi:MAG: NUDIX domain-containing protein [Clostridia bacterium]|nr:NUDIX domain-containing protein [Clostridia bacterium]
MRISSRAIIVEDGKLLAMFRRKIKNGEVKEYFAIPGGGLESGETLEQNVVRELKEEMNVDIKILGYLGSRNNEEHYFHAEIVSGEVKLSGEELDRMTPENYYEPMWLDVAELDPSKINGIDIIQKAIKKEYVLLDEENQK